MFDLYAHPYRDALLRWYRSYRCVAGEHEALVITPDPTALRLALLLPVREDTSYQELQSLWIYRWLNAIPSVQAERFVAISPEEAADLAAQGEVLRSMESAARLEEFDLVIALLDQPEDIVGLLRLLEQAKIPARAAQREQKPLLYGVGRLGRAYSPLMAWLDAFLVGDPLSVLLETAPRWQAQKQANRPFTLPNTPIPARKTWPSEIANPAVDALPENARDLLWALGQWHIQGCAFCRDALLRETVDTTLSRLLQSFLDDLQPGPQTPRWERWELWLQQARQAHLDANSRSFGFFVPPVAPPSRRKLPAAESTNAVGDEQGRFSVEGVSNTPPQNLDLTADHNEQPHSYAVSVKTEGASVSSVPVVPTHPSESPPQPEPLPANLALGVDSVQRVRALRALGLDAWLDRMMYRQDEWALCMAWDAYPAGLAGTQEEEAWAWHDTSIAFLPWMWRERLAQRHTRIPLDILVGSPGRGAQEALAWARIGRKATQISKLYQRNGRVKLFVHPWLPLPSADLAETSLPSHGAWKETLDALEQFAEAWDFRVKIPLAWRRTFGVIYWRGETGLAELAEAISRAAIDLQEDAPRAESLWQACLQTWEARFPSVIPSASHAPKDSTASDTSTLTHREPSSQGQSHDPPQSSPQALRARRDPSPSPQGQSHDPSETSSSGVSATAKAHCSACGTPHQEMSFFLQNIREYADVFLSPQGVVNKEDSAIPIPSNPNQYRCRLHYARTGYATLMTQKDFLPMLQSTLRRSGLPFLRDTGDTVTARFAHDLPLGASSLAEFVDLSFYEMPPLDTMLARLQEHAIEGLSFLSVAPLHARLLGISKVISAWQYFCLLPTTQSLDAWREIISQRISQPCSFVRKEQTYQANLQTVVPFWEIIAGASRIPSSWTPWLGDGLVITFQDSQDKSPRPSEVFTHLLGVTPASWQILRLESGRILHGAFVTPMQDVEKISI